MRSTALPAFAVSLTMLFGGLRTAQAQQSEVSCVDSTVIRQCEIDAREADRLAKADKRARACQRRLDVSDGGLQQCQTQGDVARRAAEDLAVQAGRNEEARDARPEWLHVAGFVVGAFLAGAGVGFLLSS